MMKCHWNPYLLPILIVLGVSSWATANSWEFRRISQSSISSTRGSLLPYTSSDVHPLGTSGDGSGNNSITNHLDVRYSTNITLGGKEFVVALDTGSTDLWVLPDDRGEGVYNVTDISVQMRYGDGTYGVDGTIAIAPFQMGTFNVSQQAFLHVDSYTVRGLKELGIDGLLGLSFDFVTASPINRAVTARLGQNVTWGSSVLRNIFSQNGRNETNFIGLDLSRTNDLEDTDGGSFSIGEYAEQWKGVAQAPKLYQYPQGSDRWTTLLEGITVGGTPLNLSSLVRGTPKGRLIALLDTGDPTAVIPRNVRNDLYSRIPGAVTFTQGETRTWLIPCNTTTIVEFTFGGKNIPIHPLDLSYLSRPITLAGNQYTACIASMDGDDGLASNGFEMSLGDIFLRNVYSVFDFGDSNGTAAGQPYMQLLPKTDAANATTQVASFRNRTMADLPPEIEPAKLVELLVAEDPTVRPAPSTAPPCNCSPTVAPLSVFKRQLGPTPEYRSLIEQYGPIILGLLVVNAVIGVTILVLAVLNFRQRQAQARRNIRSGPHYVPMKPHATEDKVVRSSGRPEGQLSTTGYSQFSV